MKKKVSVVMFAVLLGMILVVSFFLTGCGEQQGGVRKIEAKLSTISYPYYIDQNVSDQGKDSVRVVTLSWEREWAVSYGGVPPKSENFGQCKIWIAFPADKIPAALLGQRVEKTVRLSYYVIDPSVPLIRIKGFEIL